jgi:hypothetical protein
MSGMALTRRYTHEQLGETGGTWNQSAGDELDEERVAIRWSRGSLHVNRKAATLHGAPWQTCSKEVAFRQAVADLGAQTHRP